MIEVDFEFFDRFIPFFKFCFSFFKFCFRKDVFTDLMYACYVCARYYSYRAVNER